MKTSRLVLAPAVAVALTGLAGAPAFAATESTATVPQQPLCAQGDQQSSNSSESDSSVPEESDPQATLAQAQVTRADIANDKKGIGFSGTGFTPDEKATVTVVGTDGTEYSPDKKLTVDDDGKVSGTYFFTVTDGAQVPVGEYSLYLTDLKSEKKSSKVTFEVVSKASEVDDPGKGDNKDDDKCDSATGPIKTPDETPSETESPKPSETKTEEPTTEAPKPSETKTEEPTTEAPKPSPSETDEADDKDKAPADDVKPGPAEAPDKEPTTEAPKPTETETEAPKDEEPKDEEPKVDESEGADDAAEDDEKAEDEAPESTGPASPGTEDKKPAAAAQASMFINPTEVSSEDFLNEGIKIGVSGAQPGEKVSITVEHAQGKVDRYTMTKEADSEGKVTFGVQAKVKAVLGTYNVRAQAESFDEPQGGSFTVLTNGTAVDEGGNGNGSGSNDSGSDLPRTGAEMTGLALGVGLLAVGAAAVIITRRRMNSSDDPAEF